MGLLERGDGTLGCCTDLVLPRGGRGASSLELSVNRLKLFFRGLDEAVEAVYFGLDRKPLSDTRRGIR